MPIPQLLFYLFAGLIIVSALIVLFTKNVLHAAFSLLFTFLGIAAVYVLAGADFIAITQIIVYVGGILVLMIFGVMLTNRVEGQAVVAKNHNLFWGLLIGFGMLAVLTGVIFSVDYTSIDWIRHATFQEAPVQDSAVRTIGQLLMSQYVLPFELAGLLLLIALMGAAFIAKRTTD